VAQAQSAGSPGVCRGVAGGSATAAEAEQKAALEHPRRRGYPPGMGVEAIAHRNSLSMGRGRKTGSAAAFSDKARAPVASGGPATRRRRPVARLTWRGADRRRRRKHGTRTAVGVSLGQRGGGFEPDERAVETARARRRRGQRGTVGRAVGTLARGPNSALKARERRGMGTWQPHIDGALTGGPGAESGG
jgi:hypothetical protein